MEEMFQSPIGTQKTKYRQKLLKEVSSFQSPIGTQKTLV